jgi:hypothetical protein
MKTETKQKPKINQLGIEKTKTTAYRIDKLIMRNDERKRR